MSPLTGVPMRIGREMLNMLFKSAANVVTVFLRALLSSLEMTMADLGVKAKEPSCPIHSLSSGIMKGFSLGAASRELAEPRSRAHKRDFRII